MGAFVCFATVAVGGQVESAAAAAPGLSPAEGYEELALSEMALYVTPA